MESDIKGRCAASEEVSGSFQKRPRVNALVNSILCRKAVVQMREFYLRILEINPWSLSLQVTIIQSLEFHA